MESFAKQESQHQALLSFSKDANIRIKEDYEMLEDRYMRHASENEKLVAELRDEVKDIQERTLMLQEFYDKYDVMLTEQRQDLTD